MGCCAISMPQTAAALAGLARAAARLQLSGPVWRRPGGGGLAGGWAARRARRGWAAAIRRCRLRMCIEINALTLEGADGPQLSRERTWAPALLTEAAVRDLAETWFAALAALVRHAAQPGAGGRTPSDLPLVVADAGRDRAAGARSYPRIEDILPLSPLQEGLLFHALYDAAGAGRLYGAARARA